MISIAAFVFNMFQENTYVLYDETNECIIIDPGCYDVEEQDELLQFIQSNNLKPVQLINTHCHVDHIIGNKFIYKQFNLQPVLHRLEEEPLKSAPTYARVFGVNIDPSPAPASYIDEGDEVKFGGSKLQVLFTPGHSPGEICLYSKENNFLIAGDVLFQQSIGRTDLPGGDHRTLIASIKEKLFPLPDATRVLPGHGPETTIGFEKKYNPFLQ